MSQQRQLWPEADWQRPVQALHDWHGPWTRWALVFLLIAAVCALLPLLDNRLLLGVSVWLKPFKFALSIAVYFATLAAFAPLLGEAFFNTRSGRILTAVPIVCAIFEQAYIVHQAVMGETSHFNVSTPFHGVMYTLMGVGAVLMVTVCGVMGALILWRYRLSSAMALAVGLGLLLAFALGGGFGGYLSMYGSHWVGGTPSDAGGLPLLSWSTDGGDLRVAHFWGLHAMQLLPLLAWPLTRFLPHAAVPGVFALALIYAALSSVTFLQALQGRPMIG